MGYTSPSSGVTTSCCVSSTHAEKDFLCMAAVEPRWMGNLGTFLVLRLLSISYSTIKASTRPLKSFQSLFLAHAVWHTARTASVGSDDRPLIALIRSGTAQARRRCSGEKINRSCHPPHSLMRSRCFGAGSSLQNEAVNLSAVQVFEPSRSRYAGDC